MDRICRECREGKHVNCDGTTWRNDIDQLDSCMCHVCLDMTPEEANGYGNLADAIRGIGEPNNRLPLHRTEAGYPRCSTCDGAGCLDCTDPA